MKWIAYIDVAATMGHSESLYLCYGHKAHSACQTRQEVEDFIQEHGWDRKCYASRCFHRCVERVALHRPLRGGLWGMEK